MIKKCVSKGIRIKIEAKFERYRLYKLSTSHEFLPNVTTNYSLVPPTKTNAIFSSTESAAIKNADEAKKRIDYMRFIEDAVNRLEGDERLIIVSRYMRNDKVTDIQVYSKNFITARTYYHKKAAAFWNLAFIWGLIEI